MRERKQSISNPAGGGARIEVSRDGQTGEARRMVTKLLLIALFVTSIPVLADTLVSGSVYFDSQKTLEEVVKLSAEKDNESILKLINNGHVSQRTDSDKDIVLLTTGVTPESPAEFRFLSGPTTYWTLTKFVVKSVESTPTPTPEQSVSPTAERKHRESESDTPFDDDNGRRIWHKVDGKWKWYPANKHPAPAKKTVPPN
jgi:hypothetical protein